MKCSGGIFTHYLASKATAKITISVSSPQPLARLLEALKLCRVPVVSCLDLTYLWNFQSLHRYLEIVAGLDI